MTSAFDALRSSPLATELTPAEAKVLGDLVVLRTLKDGEVLLPEGARDGLLHVVVSGRINVLKDGPDGRTLLHTVEPGDLVGELSFMDDQPRYAALLASGPTEVLVLDRRDFETLVDREPRVVYKVMRAVMRVAHKVQRRLSLQMRDLENYLYRTGAKY
jgi:CRP/FNR family transcriptional regulator, cyclic AMP receptor protein